MSNPTEGRRSAESAAAIGRDRSTSDRHRHEHAYRSLHRLHFRDRDQAGVDRAGERCRAVLHHVVDHLAGQRRQRGRQPTAACAVHQRPWLHGTDIVVTYWTNGQFSEQFASDAQWRRTQLLTTTQPTPRLPGAALLPQPAAVDSAPRSVAALDDALVHLTDGVFSDTSPGLDVLGPCNAPLSATSTRSTTSAVATLENHPCLR